MRRETGPVAVGGAEPDRHPGADHLQHPRLDQRGHLLDPAPRRPDGQERVERGVPAVQVVAAGDAGQPAVVDDLPQFVAQIAQYVEGRLERSGAHCPAGRVRRPHADAPAATHGRPARPANDRSTCGRATRSQSQRSAGAIPQRVQGRGLVGCRGARRPGNAPGSAAAPHRPHRAAPAAPRSRPPPPPWPPAARPRPGSRADRRSPRACGSAAITSGVSSSGR